jgi:hypothetical protein
MRPCGRRAVLLENLHVDDVGDAPRAGLQAPDSLSRAYGLERQLGGLGPKTVRSR